MSQLSPFWAAAARLGGRLDLTPLVDSPHPARAWAALDAQTLRGLGLSERHARALAGASVPLRPCPPVLRLSDPGYPARLRATPVAPPVLFTQGDRRLLEAPCVAIVGARRCTADGARMARLLSHAVADAGGVVVSGLAHGIDAAAHGAALARTVAVVGQALDQPFTRTRRALLDRILEAGGLVVSEFLPGTRASRFTFPRRNRVIAGLGLATVVVQAGERSGSLITARHAAAFGREVLAVPGHPLVGVSAGCLRLLREGATLVCGPEAVLDAVPGLRPAPGAPPAPAPSCPVLQALRQGPATIEELVEDTRLGVGPLLQRVAAHQLAGRVTALPGDRYACASRGR